MHVRARTRSEETFACWYGSVVDQCSALHDEGEPKHSNLNLHVTAFRFDWIYKFKLQEQVNYISVSRKTKWQIVYVQTFTLSETDPGEGMTTSRRFKCVPQILGSLSIHIFTLLFLLITYSYRCSADNTACFRRAQALWCWWDIFLLLTEKK